MRTPTALAAILSLAWPTSARAAPTQPDAAAERDDPRAPPPPTAVTAPQGDRRPQAGTAEEPGGNGGSPPPGAGPRAREAGLEPPAAPPEEAPPPSDAGASAASRSAAAQVEGRSMAVPTADMNLRMRPLQRAGWWTTAGAAILGTVAGVLSSLARAQEDRLNTLAGQVDPETGRFPTYEDVKDDYEEALRKGKQYATAAQVTAGIAGAALATGLVLMLVDARQANRPARRAARKRKRRVRLRARGLSFSF